MNIVFFGNGLLLNFLKNNDQQKFYEQIAKNLKKIILKNSILKNSEYLENIKEYGFEKANFQLINDLNENDHLDELNTKEIEDTIIKSIQKIFDTKNLIGKIKTKNVIENLTKFLQEKTEDKIKLNQPSKIGYIFNINYWFPKYTFMEPIIHRINYLHGKIGDKDNYPIIKFKNNPEIQNRDWNKVLNEYSNKHNNLLYFGISIDGDEHIFDPFIYNNTNNIYYFWYINSNNSYGEYFDDWMIFELTKFLKKLNIMGFKFKLDNRKFGEARITEEEIKNFYYKQINKSIFELILSINEYHQGATMKIVFFTLDKEKNFKSVKMNSDFDKNIKLEDIQWE